MRGRLMITKANVEKALKNAIDPETGISMLDMGMIEGIEVKQENIRIKMRPTSPFCPMVGYLTEEIKKKVGAVRGVKNVDVDIIH